MVDLWLPKLLMPPRLDLINGGVLPYRRAHFRTPVTATHYRMLITANGGATQTAVNEFKARTTEDGSSIFSGGSAFASTAQGGRPASSAFDASDASYWQTTVGNATPSHVGYALAAGIDPATVVEWVLRNQSGAGSTQRPTTIEYQYSTDGGTTWITSKTQTVLSSLPQDQDWVTTVSDHNQFDIGKVNSTSHPLLTKSNLRATGRNNYYSAVTTLPLTSGRLYWEVTLTGRSGSSLNMIFGLADSGFSLATAIGANTNSWGILTAGSSATHYATARYNSSSRVIGPIWTVGDVFGFVFDEPTGLLYWFQNGTFMGSVFASNVVIPSGAMIAVHINSTSDIIDINPGYHAFTYDIPMDAEPADPNPAITYTYDTDSYEYWLFEFTANNSGGTAISAAELEIHTSLGGSQALTGGIPWATNSSAWNSTNWPANAVDASTSTLWNTSSSAIPVWWGYRLAAGASITGVEAKITRNSSSTTNAPKDGTVYQSSDGFSWTTIKAFSGLTWGGTTNTIVF